MRTWFGWLLLTALLFSIGGWRASESSQVFAQPNAAKMPNTVTATGIGVVKVNADVARIILAVQVTSNELKSAQEEISSQSQKVVAGVKALKLEGMEVRIAPMSAAITPGNSAEGLKATKPSYQLTQNIQVTLKNENSEQLLEYANIVINAALANGATGTPTAGGSSPIGGGFAGGFGGTPAINAGPRVLFGVSNSDSKRREALELAIADALKNAKSLAKGAELKLGAIIAINDPPATNVGQPINEFDPNVSTLTDDFGQRETTVKITVVFGY